MGQFIKASFEFSFSSFQMTGQFLFHVVTVMVTAICACMHVNSVQYKEREKKLAIEFIGIEIINRSSEIILKMRMTMTMTNIFLFVKHLKDLFEFGIPTIVFVEHN